MTNLNTTPGARPASPSDATQYCTKNVLGVSFRVCTAKMFLPEYLSRPAQSKYLVSKYSRQGAKSYQQKKRIMRCCFHVSSFPFLYSSAVPGACGWTELRSPGALLSDCVEARRMSNKRALPALMTRECPFLPYSTLVALMIGE